jgi:cytochrome c-type biogenesis protein CcmH
MDVDKPEPPQPHRTSRWGALLAALMLALLVAGIVWRTLPAPQQATTPASDTPPLTQPSVALPGAADPGTSVESMVQSLAERLQNQPDDAEGWAMLGRSYLVLQRHSDAAAALKKSLALAPQDAQTHADLGDALAFIAGRRFEGEPERLIQRALQLDPKNAKALELTGTLAFDRKDFKLAVQQWQAALAQLNPQSPGALNLQAGILQAQRLGGQGGQSGPASLDPGKAAAGARISGRITLAPALKARVQPDDTVLIFARLVDGPRMPVALLKRRAADLPLNFVLDESSAVNPSLRLSPSMQVVVGVRVSRSGQATPQSGDLQGFSEPTSVGSHGLLIDINEAVK